MKVLFNKQFTRIAILLLLLCNLTNIQAESWSSDKKKEINQSFPVSVSDLLRVDNRYGNITVSHWNKSEVAIQVIIEVKASNEKRAQEELDRVTIQMQKHGNTISAVTNLASSNRNNNKTQLTIDYFITLPSGLAIDLEQKYGNIVLPNNNTGKSKLTVKYGNIKAGSFTADLNLEAKYSNVELGNIAKMRMDLGYCGSVSVDKGELIDIESKYSNVDINSAQKMNMEIKYGNLKLKEVGSLNINSKYSDVKIRKLSQELRAGDISYGTIEIESVSPNFSRIQADARYGNLKIAIPSSASFNVKAEGLKYGSVDVKGFNITKSDVKEKSYYHYEINGGKNGSIYFDGNNYSNLKIKVD